MRPDRPIPLQIKGVLYDSPMRWTLAGLELWLGLRCLGVVSIEWVADQIRHRLDDIALNRVLDADLRGDYDAFALLRVPPKSAQLPLPVGPPSRRVRTERRERRRAGRPRKERTR